MAHEESVEEFLARGGKIYEAKQNERGGSPEQRVAQDIIMRIRSRRNAARRAAYAKTARKEAKLEAVGYEFNLTKKWVLEKLQAGVCEVTGIPFELEAKRKDGKSTHPFSPSVDRIDSLRGYTKNNCQMVVWIYNRAKGEDSHKDVIKLAKALLEE